MEKPTYYLLCSIIEMPEGVSTGHFLYTDLNLAIDALEPEIHSCADNFNFEEGKFQANTATRYEWRNQDGYGFEVWIEEISPIK